MGQTERRQELMRFEAADKGEGGTEARLPQGPGASRLRAGVKACPLRRGRTKASGGVIRGNIINAPMTVRRLLICIGQPVWIQPCVDSTTHRLPGFYTSKSLTSA